MILGLGRIISRKEVIHITNRMEIALRLTLKQLDNFKYNFQDFGGDNIESQAHNNAEIAIKIFKEIYESLADVVTD